jgi:hypothetical protein
MADVVAQVRLAMSVREFCRRYDFSKSTYYNLKRRGLGPRTMRVGNREKVTPEAAAEWVSKMEAVEAARQGAK